MLRINPRRQVRQVLELAGLQVRQLPVQTAQVPLARMVLGAQSVQADVEVQARHRGPHLRHLSVERKWLSLHSVQIVGSVVEQTLQPGPHRAELPLFMTKPAANLVQIPL